jgi:hypothetical protein
LVEPKCSTELQAECDNSEVINTWWSDPWKAGTSLRTAAWGIAVGVVIAAGGLLLYFHFTPTAHACFYEGQSGPSISGRAAATGCARQGIEELLSAFGSGLGALTALASSFVLLKRTWKRRSISRSKDSLATHRQQGNPFG